MSTVKWQWAYWVGVDVLWLTAPDQHLDPPLSHKSP